MALEDFEALATLDIPHAQRVVPTPRNGMAAIHAENEGANPVSMALEDFEALATIYVPNSYCFIGGTTY